MFFKKKQPFKENDLDSIISGCIDGEQLAQKTLIKLFYSFAKSICMRYVTNKQDVDDIINHGFLKVFNNLAKYDHTQPFNSWFRKIFVNTAIDHYRKNQPYDQQVDIDDIEVINIDVDVISKITTEEIQALVHCLSPAYKMAFTLYVIEGFTHREIADMLGISEGTSKSNLMDARRKLQQMIKNTYPHLYLAYTLKPTKINEN